METLSRNACMCDRTFDNGHKLLVLQVLLIKYYFGRPNLQSNKKLTDYL